MKPQTLQEWVDQSPNASVANTLIATLGISGGRVVYTSYTWNLRHNDPKESPVYVLPNGKIIPQGTAHALLSAAR